jgi:uncharacterized protein (DUF362 family)
MAKSNKIDRRRFLATSSAALLGWQLPFARTMQMESEHSNASPVVWEAEGISYDRVSSLLEALGGIQQLLPADPARATVIIKPNLCLPDGPGRGTTTSAGTVELFCRWFIGQGVRKIVIVDHTLQKSSDFANVGIAKLPTTYPEIKLVLACEERMYEPVAVAGKVLRSVSRLKLLSKADLVVNFATAKHHAAAHVSLGVKNLMGAIWDRAEFHTGMDLAQAIGDLPLAIKPALTVIDASRVLLNGGPTGPGPVVRDNRIFAGRDIVAVDAVVVSRYNFGERSLSPTDVTHLKAAAENGAGEIDLEKISLKKV